MLAAVLYGPNDLRLEDVKVPKIKAIHTSVTVFRLWEYIWTALLPSISAYRKRRSGREISKRNKLEAMETALASATEACGLKNMLCFD